MKSHWAAGNVKMKGKKFKLLKCGCCECQDFRDKNTEKFKEQEKKWLEKESKPQRKEWWEDNE